MSQKRLLLVEDDVEFRLVMAESLADAGFAVFEAEDGDHAAEMLRRLDLIDLLVTDIEMPGRCDGNVVAARAKDCYCGLPVVYVSGQPGSVTNTIGACDAFVLKPFHPSSVIAIIRRLLAAAI
jgi:two-component system, response regulator PdtaR